MMKKIFLLLLFLTITECGFAQVVTSSLDPTLPNLVPSASAWRFGNTLGISASSGSGETTKNFQEKDKQIASSAMEYLAAFQLPNITVEGYYSPYNILDYKDSSVDGINLDFTHIMISLKSDFLSIGAIKDQEVAEIEGRDQDVKRGSLGTGISIRLGWLYLGGGRTKVFELESDRVKNNWMNSYIGIALLIGEPGKNLFRMEYSQMSSPRTEKSAEGVPGTKEYKEKNIHYKTRELRHTVEFVYNRLLFSYYKLDQTINTDYTVTGVADVEKTTTTMNRYGLGGFFSSGLSLALYRIDWKKEVDYVWLSGSKRMKTDRAQTWKLSLGANF